MDARPAIDDLTVSLGTRVSVPAGLFLLEVADIAGGFEESAGFARDIRENRGFRPIFVPLGDLLRRLLGIVFGRERLAILDRN
jgi:hypothetical protein